MSKQQYRNGFIITCCVAGILIVAATLKIIAAAREWVYFGSGSAFIGKEVGIAFVELTIVAVLFTGWKKRSTWIITSVLFGVFALVQTWNIFIGQHTCDCLGVVSSGPLSLLMLDISIAVISFLFCLSIPVGEQTAIRWSSGLWKAVKVIGVAFSSVVFLTALSYLMISLKLEHRLSKNSLVTPRSFQLSSTPFSNKSIRFTELPIRNISQQPVTIVGVNTTCSTRLGQELPVQVQPGEILYLPVAAKNKREGRQMLTAEVYSDVSNEIRSTKVWRVEF